AAAGLLAEHEPAGPARLRALERRAAEGGELAWQLDAAVRPLAPPAEASLHLPAQLTARARRALERGRDLLAALRGLAGDPAVTEPGAAAALLREAASLTDAALRLVLGLPDSPSAQLQHCEGIEAVLEAAAHKLACFGELSRRHAEESGRVAM